MITRHFQLPADRFFLIELTTTIYELQTQACRWVKTEPQAYVLGIATRHVCRRHCVHDLKKLSDLRRRNRPILSCKGQTLLLPMSTYHPSAFQKLVLKYPSIIL